ncbi:endonuclease domain-containing protein [Quadrisphaera sp. DSM 44207]|uniref:endonuclease domain-containing protein n=1 Tax=Quadrisphaera sp. DSM 44207 TaxID=1881057 RepID=UPI000881B8F9|nr:hypothetical protein [Quadrisphaera sp. DSM 44207]SDQ64718.1 hypothetical protein SAMN05428996_2225 [Quadrisphaera sp. DSM 44207]
MSRTLLPPHLRDRPFAVAEARAAGVPASSLRGRGYRRPFRGVRVPAHLPDDVLTRCLAAALVLPGEAAFCGPTAALLCDLPLPRRLPAHLRAPLHVRVPDPGGVPHLPGVRSGEGLVPDAVRRHARGLRVLHPLHTWVELAPHLGHVDAVALGDAVRRRWADGHQMAEAVRAQHGRRGVVRLREALADVRDGVDSPPETQVRLLLRGAGLPEPCCGRDVVDASGWIARPDLSWPAAKVAAEYDGEHHRTDPRQWAADIRRRELLEAAGWTVLVVTADDLQHPARTVARVQDALARRGVRL